MASEVLKLIFRGQDDTNKAVRSLQSNLAKADKAIGKIKGSLGGMTGALGAAAGVAGFGALAKSALESADELGKVSARLGTTASELGSLQLAANFAGVETKTFNKLMEIFQKRVGEAAQGTGQAKDQLEAFGIDAGKLAKLPLDKQLKLIADAFQDIDTPAAKAAAASDLFSNRGIKLINVLDGGSEGLSDLRDEYRRLGLEIDQEAIGSVESFNDSMTKLSGIVNTAMIKALGDLAPEMESLADAAAEAAVPLIGDLMDGLTFIVKNIDAITSGVKAFVVALAAAKVVSFALAVTQLVTALGGMSVILAAISAPVTAVVAVIVGATAAFFAFREEIEDGIKAVGKWLGLVDDTEKDVKSASREIDRSTDITAKYVDSVFDAATETEGFSDEIFILRRETKDTDPVVQDFGDSAETVAGQEAEAALETSEFKDAIEALRKAARTSADDFSDVEAQLEEFKAAVEAGEASTEDYNQALRNTIGEVTGVEDELGELRREIDSTKRLIELSTEAFGENDAHVVDLKKRLEELGGELVEAVQNTSSMTEAQRELLGEVTANDRKLAELRDTLADLKVLYDQGAISATQYSEKMAEIRGKIVDLKREMDGLGKKTEESFVDEPINDFFKAIADGRGANGALAGLGEDLIGNNGVKSAIAGCFGVKPVQDFDQAIRDIFTGSGSAIGGLQVALGGLTDALGNFFAQGELDFDAFKDAILRTLADIAAGAVASVGINFLKNLIPGLNTGGEVQGYAVGGRVTGAGGPKEDKVLARLSPGEYVINAASVSKFGSTFFDQLNAGRVPGFADGGAISAWQSGNLSTLGATPGLGQVVGAIATLVNLFEKFAPGVGTSRGEYNNQIRGSLAVFTRGSVGAAMDGIESVFGSNPYDKITNRDDIIRNDATPISVQDIIADEIWGSILGPSSSNAAHDAVKNKLPEIGDGLASELFNYLGQKMTQIAIPNFNMDGTVDKLFNSAQGVAGGSLTLAAREMGGPLERGQPSLVGEGGPELFVPGRGGTVSPITRDGANSLVEAVHEVRDEISDLRRQFSRALSGGQLAGAR